MNQDELNSILMRLDRLERYHRRWKRGALAACAGLVLLFVGFAPLDKFTTRFRYALDVQDGRGQSRIALVVDPKRQDILRIELKDQKGADRLSFFVDDQTSDIVLSKGPRSLRLRVADNEAFILYEEPGVEPRYILP